MGNDVSPVTSAHTAALREVAENANATNEQGLKDFVAIKETKGSVNTLKESDIGSEVFKNTIDTIVSALKDSGISIGGIKSIIKEVASDDPAKAALLTSALMEAEVISADDIPGIVESLPSPEVREKFAIALVSNVLQEKGPEEASNIAAQLVEAGHLSADGVAAIILNSIDPDGDATTHTQAGEFLALLENKSDKASKQSTVS